MAIIKKSSNLKGIIFNIQRYSINDGPGIRTTIFIKGCPLHCSWCSNPESQRKDPEIIVRDLKCISSGKCEEICPQGAIKLVESESTEPRVSPKISTNIFQPFTNPAAIIQSQPSSKPEKKRVINWSKCDQCLKCAEVCPSKSIEISGRQVDVAECLEEILRDKAFYAEDGGMTISGGDPLTQIDFIKELFMASKMEGLNTAIDTTGYGSWDNMEKIIPYVDLFLYDIKHMDPKIHEQETGVTNQLILSNLKKLAKTDTRIWVRCPLIPDFNDSKKNISQLAGFVKDLGDAVEKVSLLPYHRYGETKYDSTGRIYPYAGKQEQSREDLEILKNIFEEQDLKVSVGG